MLFMVVVPIPEPVVRWVLRHAWLPILCSLALAGVAGRAAWSNLGRWRSLPAQPEAVDVADLRDLRAPAWVDVSGALVDLDAASPIGGELQAPVRLATGELVGKARFRTQGELEAAAAAGRFRGLVVMRRTVLVGRGPEAERNQCLAAFAVALAGLAACPIVLVLRRHQAAKDAARSSAGDLGRG